VSERRRIYTADAIEDPRLLGGLRQFRDAETWRPWLAFLRAVEGQPLRPAELELFRRHTGRAEPKPEGYPEAALITGRQSGKSAISAAVSVLGAIQATEPGLYAPMVAQDARSVLAVLMRYARSYLANVEAFRSMIHRETREDIELANGCTITVRPCRPESVRGIRSVVAVLDEAAYFRASDGYRTDTEMLRAIRPSLATTDGRLLVLSSPYHATGALWDLHRKHYGVEASDVLVWQAGSVDMNPTISRRVLERLRDDDPIAYESEVLAMFRTSSSALLSDEAVQSATAEWIEREREEGHRYIGTCDPSGGRADDFALAIGHAEPSERLAVVDVVRTWSPPFQPPAVVAEASELLKSYGVREVTGDRFGGEWPVAAFAEHGVRYRVPKRTTSDGYLAALPVFNAGRVAVPRLARLLHQLRTLERRRGTAGRDRVDHPRGAHDDAAAATCSLIVELDASMSDRDSEAVAPPISVPKTGAQREHRNVMRAWRRGAR